MGKLIIFSAPSGAGKTTIVKHLLRKLSNLEFSVSATSRPLRQGETDGKDYYFLSTEEFKKKIDRDEFLEWEEVYSGVCYGTLKSEINRIWEKGSHVLFDVDVVGGLNIKKQYPDNALAIFVMPPNSETLAERLCGRGTDSEESIQKRLDKAEWELTFAPKFDIIIVNDDLEKAVEETINIVTRFISK